MPSSIVINTTIKNLRSLARKNWLEISRIQYVVFTESGDFNLSLGLLIQGLDMDLEWLRIWSQMRQTAQIWTESRDDSYLWSEMRLKPVREMVKKRGQSLSELEREFLRPEQERLLEEIDNPGTSAHRRYEIGLRLNMIGDTRPGVGVVQESLPSITGKDEIRLWKEQYRGLPDIVWCWIPSGKVTLDDNAGTFNVEPFLLAKYPVTYIQFRTFFEADDGFRNPLWRRDLAAWEDASYDEKKAYEQHFKFDNHPADSISWFDALAFCLWLGSRVNLPIRLPTEWEWQHAASGGIPENLHPWGSERDSSKANTIEQGLSRSSAVGVYPAGASLFGPLDMSGNVREWCANEHNSFEYLKSYVDIIGFRKEYLPRVQRGGGWNTSLLAAQTNFREWSLPHLRATYYGFRIAVSVSEDFLASIQLVKAKM